MGERKMIGKKATKMFLWACSGVLMLLTFGVCIAASDWAGLVAPLGAIFSAVFVFESLRCFLWDTKERYAQTDFVRSLHQTFAVPLWLVFTMLYVFFAGMNPPIDEAFADLMVSLSAVILFVAVPGATLVFGVLSIVNGARHLRATTSLDGRFYHEGPVVLASLMLVLEMSALGMAAFYCMI